jgi:hypothetical protein
MDRTQHRVVVAARMVSRTIEADGLCTQGQRDATGDRGACGRSGDEFADDPASNIGEAECSTLEAGGEFSVIEPEQV